MHLRVQKHFNFEGIVIGCATSSIANYINGGRKIPCEFGVEEFAALGDDADVCDLTSLIEPNALRTRVTLQVSQK